MKVSNKIPFLLALVLSSSLAANPNSYTYLAANAGIYTGDFDVAFHDQSDVITQDIEETISQHGYAGGIAFGYRYSFNAHYFVGAEFSVNGVSDQASFASGASTSAFSDTLQIQNFGDLTFVPGIYLSESVASYLKLGLSVASIDANLTTPMGYDPTYAEFHSHGNEFGFVAGIGVLKSLTDHVIIFVEGLYHDYGTVNFDDFQNFTAYYTHSADIFSYQVAIGAAYKWS